MAATDRPLHPARRPLHLRLPAIGLAVAGGIVGTLARHAITSLAPQLHGMIATLAVNVVGAFLLGWLLEALVRSGPDTRTRTILRLGLGTGVLGGFTTYSTYATGVAHHLLAGHVGVGLAYAALTLVAGAAASIAGIAAGAATTRGVRR